MSGLVIATLEDALQAWVQSQLPVTVPSGQPAWKAVWAQQNAPAGEHHLALWRWSIRKVGQDVHGAVNPSNGRRAALGTRELRGQMRAYGRGAMQVMEDLRTLMDDDQHVETLAAGALTLVSVSNEVVNLANLFSSQFQEVGMIEMVLRTHSYRAVGAADAESVGTYIQSVEIEKETHGPVGSPVSETLEIVA